MITGAYTRFACADETTVDLYTYSPVALDNGKRLKPLVHRPSRNAITKSTFISAKMPLPSPPLEQAAIVRFLDYADRRIQRYIRANAEADHAASSAVAGAHPPGRHGSYADSGTLSRASTCRLGGRWCLESLRSRSSEISPNFSTTRQRRSNRKQMMTVRSEYKRTVKGDIAYNMMRMWQAQSG